MPSSASEAWKSSETAVTRAMSAGSQRETARRRRSVGRSRRRKGGGVSGEGAAAEAEARRRERRGGVDIARKSFSTGVGARRACWRAKMVFSEALR